MYQFEYFSAPSKLQVLMPLEHWEPICSSSCNSTPVMPPTAEVFTPKYHYRDICACIEITIIPCRTATCKMVVMNNYLHKTCMQTDMLNFTS